MDQNDLNRTSDIWSTSGPDGNRTRPKSCTVLSRPRNGLQPDQNAGFLRSQADQNRLERTKMVYTGPKWSQADQNTSIPDQVQSRADQISIQPDQSSIQPDQFRSQPDQFRSQPDQKRLFLEVNRTKTVSSGPKWSLADQNGLKRTKFPSQADQHGFIRTKTVGAGPVRLIKCTDC